MCSNSIHVCDRQRVNQKCIWLLCYSSCKKLYSHIGILHCVPGINFNKGSLIQFHKYLNDALCASFYSTNSIFLVNYMQVYTWLQQYTYIVLHKLFAQMMQYLKVHLKKRVKDLLFVTINNSNKYIFAKSSSPFNKLHDAKWSLMSNSNDNLYVICTICQWCLS